jgi:hypothetical protein
MFFDCQLILYGSVLHIWRDPSLTVNAWLLRIPNIMALI